MTELAQSTAQENTEAAPEAKTATTESAAAPAKEIAPAGGKQPDEVAKERQETEAKKEAGIPERYELQLPKDSLLKQEHVDKVAAEAKARGLSNEDAQKLLERDNSVVSGYLEQTKQNLTELSNKWVDQIKADKELGGEKFNENAELAKRVVGRFATDDFKKVLSESGFGNHPELVRVFARIGRAMSSDKLVIPGSNVATKSKSMEDVFYGDAET